MTMTTMRDKTNTNDEKTIDDDDHRDAVVNDNDSCTNIGAGVGVGVQDDDDDGDEWFHFAASTEEDQEEELGVGGICIDDDVKNDKDNTIAYIIGNGASDALPPVRPTVVPPPPPPSTPAATTFLLEDIPEQLHPAVSLGMRHVSSCYFSIQSHNSGDSYNSLIDLLHREENKKKEKDEQQQADSYISLTTTTANAEDDTRSDLASRIHVRNHSQGKESDGGSLLSYHECLMEVCTYLSTKDLVSFSQTCRRSNFEVFYFLQLKLQKSLLLDVEPTPSSPPRPHGNPQQPNSTTLSCDIVSRLARLDNAAAKKIVDEYLASNSTLRTLPLSYSLAYIRYYLAQKGLSGGLQQFLVTMMQHERSNDHRHNQNRDKTQQELQSTDPQRLSNSDGDASVTSTTNPATFSQQALAKAALLVTFVGAVGGAVAAGGGVDVAATVGSDMALQGVLGMGFLGSLMMGGAATASNVATRQHDRVQNDETVSDNDNDESKRTAATTRTTRDYTIPSMFEMKKILQATASAIAEEEDRNRPTVLFDPYDHLPQEQEEDNGEFQHEGIQGTENDAGLSNTSPSNDVRTITKQSKAKDRKMPSGCVGAFSKAIKHATEGVVKCIKEQRKAKFQSLAEDSQWTQLSLEFLTVCSSNDTLDRVKEIASRGIDTDGFYVGPDGQLSCALHTAAFNGADEVVDYLCTSIGETSQEDGGLADVDLIDGNGWTALHFAAGANSIPVVKVLCKHGADQHIQASNGYTPLLWAKRLSNKDVADELANASSSKNGPSIASRFLALIPSN